MLKNLKVKMIRKVSSITRQLIFEIRNYYYHQLFNVGKNTTFLGKVLYYNPHLIKIGNNCSINEGVFFNVSDNIIVGDNVTISANVFITTATLNIYKFPEKKHERDPIKIEDDAWIGAGSTILPGVVVGKGAIVAAGAVVTKDVPPHTVVLGIPARVTKNLKGFNI